MDIREERQYQDRGDELFEVRGDCLSGPLAREDRIANRIADLRAKRRLSRSEREELAILTYDGPVPRRIPFSDEVPF